MPTNAEKLREAARLIEEVRRAMNTREKICDCCGHKTKESWSEHQVAERLEGLPKKLRAMSGCGAIVERDAKTRLAPNTPTPSGEAT